MKKLLVLIFLFFIPTFSASKELSGVFLERESKMINAPSVLIKQLSLLNNVEEVEFQFEIEFLPPIHYGNIFHLFQGSNKLLSIVYSPNQVNNKRGFIFSIAQENFSESFLPDQGHLFDNPIELKIIISEEEIVFLINENKLSAELDNNFLTSEELKIYFGGLPNKREVTNFYLREFSFKQSNVNENDSLFWNFERFEENLTYDEFKNHQAELRNAIPVVTKQFNWVQHEQIKVPKLIAYGFDFYKDKFYSLSKKGLDVYSFQNRELRTFELSEEPPFERGFLIKNPFTNDLLFSWDGGGAKVSKLDTVNLNWSAINNSSKSTHYFGASRFINPHDSALYMFGGYGHYEFKNILQRYNEKIKTWEIVKTTGETIPPRKPFLSNIVSDSLIYIGGGIGSKSGDQTLESRSFADLYEMNLKTFHITRVTDLFDLDVNQRLENFFYVKESDELYFPIVTQRDSLESFQFYRYDFENDTSFMVGKSFSVKVKKSLMGRTHYFPNSQKVIHFYSTGVTDEYRTFGFYEIQVPIISKAELNSHMVSKNNSSTFFVIVIIVVGVFTLTYVLGRKKKRNFSNNTNKQNPPNAIFLLGNFKIFDKSGINIASSFSIKTLETFLLLVVNSYKVNNFLSDDGISSSELANTLWPNYDKDSQKNNRNVTINKLRNLLSSVEGLEIVYENSRWKIKSDKEFYVDFIELDKILSAADSKKLIQFINSNPTGGFSNKISYSWLDPVTITINRYLHDSIFKIYRDNKSDFSNEEMMKLGKALLSIDELSECGISLVIYSQKLSGNENGYHNEFELFSKKFRDITGEKFKKSPEELINLYF